MSVVRYRAVWPRGEACGEVSRYHSSPDLGYYMYYTISRIELYVACLGAVWRF